MEEKRHLLLEVTFSLSIWELSLPHSVCGGGPEGASHPGLIFLPGTHSGESWAVRETNVQKLKIIFVKLEVINYLYLTVPQVF